MNAETRLLCGAFALAVTNLVGLPARAIERDEVIVRAKAFSFHPWTVSQANLTASCKSSYKSVYTPGDYMGLPYDWGGYMTLFDFDQQIANGAGAGSYPEDGVLSCTAGLDCSGFVSKTWKTGHFSTSTIHQTSSAIAQNQMLPGDVYNKAGYHVVLYSHTLGSGEPVFYESVGYNVHVSAPGWSWVNGYTPRRYDSISGTTAGNPIGTTTNPIDINSFPYSDQRNTAQSKSDMLDGCGASPSKKETGPEYVYRVTLNKPGTLTASIQDDVGVDIDVHLYTSTNTSDCFARHDNTLSKALDCGTYYIVADTFKGTQEYPGAYSLSVAFTPSGGGCGNGPPSYDFEGKLGDPCAYPGDPNLPFCNENLGSKTCIYNQSTSFCSKPCGSDQDCGIFPGGCCAQVNSGESYCMIAALCSSGSSGGAGTDDPPGPGGDPAAGGASAAGVGGGDAELSSGAGANGPVSHGAAEDDDGTATAANCSWSPSDQQNEPWALWSLLSALAIGRRRARKRTRSHAQSAVIGGKTGPSQA